MDFTKKMNDQGISINRKLKSALNSFFTKHPDAAEGCLIRKKYGADYVLIVEESDLYHYLQGEFGWSIHTDFYNAFTDCGFSPEKINSCEIGFYKE